MSKQLPPMREIMVPQWMKDPFYTEVPSSEDGEAEDIEKTLPATIKARKVSKKIPWIIHALLVILWVCGIARTWMVQKPYDQFQGPTPVPIEYETRTIHGSVLPDDMTPFSSGTDEEIDAAWEKLIEVGVIKLTPEEAARLPVPTDPLYDDPGFFAGNLEVLHQLHCLNRIRRKYFNPDSNDLNEKTKTQHDHIIHCFDYLRQNIQCAGDTSSMSFTYRPDVHIYEPVWNVTKRCRNFDLIYEWAETRKANLTAEMVEQ